MTAVTAEYLINIIERQVNKTIGTRRNDPMAVQSPNDTFKSTNEEIADFILSTPYFDERLKRFILDSLEEQAIIISQAWEIDFIIKTSRWAESNEWLHGAFRLSMSSYVNKRDESIDFLTLPY